MTKENIYISQSIYTLYLAIILAKTKKSSTIIYLNDSDIPKTIEMRIMKKIKELLWIKNIVIIDTRPLNKVSKMMNKSIITKIIRVMLFNGNNILGRNVYKGMLMKSTRGRYGEKNYLEAQKLIKTLLEKKIYVGLDITLFFRNFVGYKSDYEIYEDGESTYRTRRENYWGLLLSSLFSSYSYCENPRVKKLHVLYPEKLPRHLKNKGEKIEIKDILLDKKQLDKIYECFLNKRFDFGSETIMILTQCFYQHGKIEKEEEQVKIYSDIIKKYKDRYNIVLKPHPSDTINYRRNEFEGVYILPNYFPIEILDFDLIVLGYKFKKVIAVSSTAVSNFSSTEESINIGEEKYKKYI